MQFQNFCALVPSAPSLLPLDVNAPLTYVTQELAEFVAPRLQGRHDVDLPEAPKVLVVSAPGAVGKSTLAKELCRLANLPYWDLAQYGPVGQGTLNGALVQSFGFSSVGQAQSLLTNGQLAFVIDALDEARVKVNESAFEAFVRDVAQSAQSSPRVSFVLFGRTQIAETTWLVLTDAGVDVGLYVIESFDREQAVHYIDRRVKALGKKAAQRMEVHAEPFSQARNLILKHLEHTIAGNSPDEAANTEARDFVGYAPVLDAVSVLLAGESNWGQLRAKLDDDAKEGASPGELNQPVALLMNVVERILEREHEEKLVANIKPALGAVAQQEFWNDWDILYTAQEQCERLVARLLGIQYQSQLQLPNRLAAQYKQQIDAWLPEHPFLRDGNSVFTSFLYARAVLKSEQGEDVVAYMSGRSYKPSKLFADFYFLECERDDGQPLKIPPEHVGLLHDALLAGESDRNALRTTLEGDVDAEGDECDAVINGEFELVDLTTMDQDEPRIISREFVTRASADDVLRFRRYLRDATIAVPCVVELGAGSEEFEIGPAVSIHAGTLRLSASTLIAGGRTKLRKIGEHDKSVVLEANRIESSVVEQPVAHVELTVKWPGCESFPWSSHASRGDAAIQEDARLRRAYVRFRRILMTLRSHSKGSLARVKNKIEHARVLQGAMGKALLQKLIGDGVLKLCGKFYHLVPDNADESTGISWTKLRRSQSTERLRNYLNDFVQANRQLFE